MGNKTTPTAFRLGVTQKHFASWFADKKSVPSFLLQDIKAREYLMKRFDKSVSISKIIINRTKESVEILIKCLKPSIIIGKKGSEIDNTVKHLSDIYKSIVKIKIFDVKRSEADAACMAKDIAREISKRGVSCRRVIKRAVQNALRAGVLGARVQCSGRLGGVEIARTEWYQEGALPRHKLRANISYYSEPSYASWGTCGVKVWLYFGDYVKKDEKVSDTISIDSRRNKQDNVTVNEELNKAYNKIGIQGKLERDKETADVKS